jgi:hypothetical protein
MNRICTFTRQVQSALGELGALLGSAVPARVTGVVAPEPNKRLEATRGNPLASQAKRYNEARDVLTLGL